MGGAAASSRQNERIAKLESDNRKAREEVNSLSKENKTMKVQVISLTVPPEQRASGRRHALRCKRRQLALQPLPEPMSRCTCCKPFFFPSAGGVECLVLSQRHLAWLVPLELPPWSSTCRRQSSSPSWRSLRRSQKRWSTGSCSW